MTTHLILYPACPPPAPAAPARQWLYSDWNTGVRDVPVRLIRPMGIGQLVLCEVLADYRRHQGIEIKVWPRGTRLLLDATCLK